MPGSLFCIMGGWFARGWRRKNSRKSTAAKYPNIDPNNNNKPTFHNSAMVEVGFRVIRGPDWKWSDQDGGDGNLGTVIEVGHVGNRLSPDRTVVVQWDNGRRTNYRVGYRGAYDLLVFDGAPAGISVKHLNKRCDGCGRRGIKGIRWQCTQCSDYNLCTRCYMENVHDLHHKFRRFLTSNSTGVLIPNPRSKSRRSQASGIFPGAKVIRGCDWMWGDQDGGPGGVGTVTEIRGWPPESENSVASVTFPGNRANVYRLGHRGKVDLKCITPAKGPMYYKDHLPVLGKDDQAPCPFSIGDQVRVCLSVDVLKQMQKDHGGWNPRMADLVGKVGVVHRITQRGDVRVQYDIPPQSSEATATSPNDNNRWTFNPAALTKVSPVTENQFSIGDRVRVIEDCSRARALHSREHRNWNAKMEEHLGRKGVIVGIRPDGDVAVKFSTKKVLAFNPDCLVLESDDAGPLEILPPEARAWPNANDLMSQIVKGDLQAVKQILQEQPDLVRIHYREKHGMMPLHIAAYKGRVEIVRYLLSKGASISAPDDEGDGALHYAIISKCLETVRNDSVRVLLEKSTPADVNLANKTKKTPLHSAVIANCFDLAKALLRSGCDVNVQDVDGDTPAHYCVVNHTDAKMLRLFVNHQNFDPKRVNKFHFNVLLRAAVKGKLDSVKVIIDRFSDLATFPKSDDGMTALHLGVLNNHEPISQLLVDKYPELINKRDVSGQTPLFLAASVGEPAIVDLLVRAGADITIRALDGRTCIEAALEKFNTEESDESNDSDMSESLRSYYGSLSLPSSPVWGEIGSVLLRNEIRTDNAVYLGIACYLVRSTLDQCLDEDDFLSNAFEVAQDEKARSILRDIQKNKSMSIIASDFSKIVNVKEDTQEKLVSSPVSRRSASQHDSMNQLSLQNYVRGLDDDASAYANEPHDCMSCGEEEASVVFRPCGHKIVCAECCIRMKKCIQCKKSIVCKLDRDGVEISCNRSLEQQETVMQLERKVRELQESNQCIICMENQRDTALKCGHRFCERCATTLRKQCPICRKPITGAIHLYN